MVPTEGSENFLLFIGIFTISPKESTSILAGTGAAGITRNGPGSAGPLSILSALPKQRLSRTMIARR